MKKLLVILLLFILNFNETAVFKEDDYYILSLNNCITTNNYTDYFENLQIIWVVVNDKKYYYTDDLKWKVIKDLEKINLKESVKVKIDGAIISKIKIQANKEKIENIKKVLKCAEFSS